MIAKGASAQEPAYRWSVPNGQWWLFCLFIFVLKFLLLALDPLPKLFMGDSGSYLWTALSGWIPPDRSFVYGFIIRWSSITTHSLSSLLILQTFLGAITALLLTFICLRIFTLPVRFAYLSGFLCALDPLQLVWERYIMTETVSLFCYALILIFSFFYLEQRRLWQLVGFQLVAVLLVSLRISYLLVVQASTILLPVLAFFPLPRRVRESPGDSPSPSRIPIYKSLVSHFALSVLLMFALHRGYQQLNGLLSGREPAYLYSTGFSILATWAPTLRPSDSRDPRLAQIISQGAQFHLSNIHLRNSQLYSPGSLLDRWHKAEPDFAEADRLAKQTALHSLVRRPLGVLSLGWSTFLGYFDLRGIHQQAKSDLGKAVWPKEITAKLAQYLSLSVPQRQGKPLPSMLQHYFLSAQPYYYVILFSPLVAGILLIFVRDSYVIVLLVHDCIFLATNSFLAVTASVRYLQPMSFLTILVFALLLKQLMNKPRLPQSPVATCKS